MKTNKTKLIGVSIAIAGLLLMVFALLNPSSILNTYSDMMGGSTGTTAYTIADMLLAIIGSFMLAAGSFTAIFKEDYERPTDLPPMSPSHPIVRPAEQAAPEAEQLAAPEPSSTQTPSSEVVDERRLVLRLLTGDERAMFRAIVESGGEALQKDLIVKTKMSDAKVSRVLDKLVEKGVISKVRHGVTNKVKVEIEP